MGCTPVTSVLRKISAKFLFMFFKVKYSLAEANRGRNYYGQQRRELAPVLGHDDKLATDTMSIQKNCGEDNICVPNLAVEASTSGAFQYGGQEKMEITAEIINNGEDAFNAMLYLQLPREINWNSASSSTPGVSVLCSAPDAMNNRTLECDVGNPFPANTRVSDHLASRFSCLKVLPLIWTMKSSLHTGVKNQLFIRKLP